MKLLEHIDLKHYWLSGRFNSLVSCKDSNVYKFLQVINNVLNNIIDKINNVYLSIYPCSGIRLLKEHELELAIPDDIFNVDRNIYGFTYKFPIPFRDDTTTNEYNPIKIRQIDVFVKKYLMQDNSEMGFKRIAGCYNYTLKFEMENNERNLTFPYIFPICFQCSKNTNVIKITIYGNPNIVLVQKLSFIFNYIKRIDMKLIIIKSEDDNIYNPKDYCPCKEFND
jgi:hypothetical protein